ncbi:MAG TPA: hypothetical protein VFY10_13495, partial [Dehalococcoidia bacterium]|nr:hypothetical protein [Dehalococcoidia bacterium]
MVQGFAPVERIDQALHHGENGVDRRDLRLGAVQDPNAPVVFEIERLCPFQADLHCDYRDGPWRFEWTPGAAAVDSV